MHKVWHLEMGLHLGCPSHLVVFLDKHLWVPGQNQVGLKHRCERDHLQILTFNILQVSPHLGFSVIVLTIYSLTDFLLLTKRKYSEDCAVSSLPCNYIELGNEQYKFKSDKKAS